MNEVDVRDYSPDYLLELVRDCSLSMNPAQVAPEHLVQISVGFEYEAFGLASDEYEEIWKIVFPTIPYHVKTSAGYRRTEVPAEFVGRTYQDAFRKAVVFFEEMKKGV